MVELTPGSSISGFTVEREENIAEIEGAAYIMHHEISGAKLLYMKNDDNNKAFSIAFKTPPKDSTGVFHILEHSVLCGSEKFPVKEPFVNLIKSSMQTFLNALTFPDKTMYPVASTNEQDLLNLMDVYMDAVLNPMIYSKKAIFEQEGWHYEIDESTGDLTFNGVVFNEMKGALSSPSAVLFNTLNQALFPETAYRFESGGDPQIIPDLTYESFLEHHKNHYRLDNSYLTVYGEVNIETILEFLDKEYLSKSEKSSENLVNPLKMQAPVVSLDNRVTMQTAPENSCLGLAYVVGTAKDRERMIAIDILVDAIAGSNEAPLKRAVLSSGIAGDFEAFFVDAMLQPLLVFQLKNNTLEANKDFRNLIESTVTDMCKNGIGSEKIESSLSRAEFVMHERDFDMADGVILSMQSLSGWLYDDEDATTYLKYNDTFKDLREKIDTDYFETLLHELIFDNDHYAMAEIVPVKTAEDLEKERLSQFKANLSPKDMDFITDNVANLRTLQEQEDTPEDLAKLPLLTLKDITKPPSEVALERRTDAPLPCLYHNIPTHEIDYLYYYFDINHLAFEDLPYLSILGTLLGKLDTDRYEVSVLDNLINARLGGLSFFSEIHEFENDTDRSSLQFIMAASALDYKLEDLCNLPAHVLCSTVFNDTSRVKDILMQRRIAMEQGFMSAGHAHALSRGASYFNNGARIREQLGGIEFYRFLKELINNFDDRSEELLVRLGNVRQKILASQRVIASFTGTEAEYSSFWSFFENSELSTITGVTTRHDNKDPEQNSLESGLIVPDLHIHNEAFIIPGDVCYTSMGYDYRLLNATYSGNWQVAGRAASFDYLWSEVRVKGGAYGAGLRLAQTGPIQFYSFRDPQLDATLQRFAHTGAWLKEFAPTEAALRGYLISSTAGHDTPKKAREIARRQDTAYFSGYPSDYRDTMRDEILGSTVDTIRELGSTITKVTEQNCYCVFGNKDMINTAKAELDIIDLLG